MATRAAILAPGHVHRFAPRLAALLLLTAVAGGLMLRLAAAAVPAVRLQGKVLRPDGRPAVRARVFIDVWRQGLIPVTTDARGAYTLTLRSGGRHWLEATFSKVGMSQLLQVKAGGPKPSTLDIRLRRLPVLTGTVTLPDGRPAAHAVLEARGAVWREVESMMDLVGEPRPPDIPGSQGKSGGTLFTIVTDGAGQYKVPLFPQGKPEHLSLFGDKTNYEVRFMSPDGRGWSEPLRLTVGLDWPVTHQDIRLNAGEQVEGVVAGYPGGKPRPKAYVYAIVPGLGPAPLSHPEVVAGAITDARGRFRIATALQPGGYTIGANAGPGWGFAGAVEAEPKGIANLGLRWVELQMVHDSRIQGRLLSPDGKPVPNKQMPVTVRTLSDEEQTEYTTDLETDAEGRYHLEFKAAWEARKPWGVGARQAAISMRGGETVMPPVTVDLTKGSDQEVDLQLAQTGSAYGQVTFPDGRPAAGVSVYLAPAADQARLWGTSDLQAFYDRDTSVRVVHRDGKFDLRGVPPGQYLVVVLACTIYQTSLEDGTALPATISPGKATGPLDIVVRPRSVIHGKLTGLPAAPGDDLTLDCIMRPSGSTARPQRVRMDLADDGSYTAWASGYGMGSYDIMFLATHDGQAFVSKVRHGVELGASSVTNGLDFTLSPGGSVSGRLALPNGKAAVTGLEVVLRPVSGDAVMLFPLLICGQDDMGERAFRTEADGKGQFDFPGLLPGRYELSVTWRPPRAAEAQVVAVPINLRENEKRTGLVVRLPQATR